jgi:hypothetical protein
MSAPTNDLWRQGTADLTDAQRTAFTLWVDERGYRRPETAEQLRELRVTWAMAKDGHGWPIAPAQTPPTPAPSNDGWLTLRVLVFSIALAAAIIVAMVLFAETPECREGMMGACGQERLP